MRILMSKREGEFLLKVLRECFPEDKTEYNLVSLLLERIELCLMLQHNEGKTKT